MKNTTIAAVGIGALIAGIVAYKYVYVPYMATPKTARAATVSSYAADPSLYAGEAQNPWPTSMYVG